MESKFKHVSTSVHVQFREPKSACHKYHKYLGDFKCVTDLTESESFQAAESAEVKADTIWSQQVGESVDYLGWLLVAGFTEWEDLRSGSYGNGKSLQNRSPYKELFASV